MLRRPWIATVLLMCATVFGARAEGPHSHISRDRDSIRDSQQGLKSLAVGGLLFGRSLPAETDCTEAMSNLSLQKLWIQDQPGGDLTTRKPLNSHPATPEQLANELKRAFPNAVNDANSQVVILVVDDFGKGNTPAMHISQDLTYSDRSIHHGFLVRNQIDKMIEELHLTGHISTAPVDLYSRSTSTPNQRSLTTLNSLATRIQQAITDHGGASHFVVNMSYVQLSCRVLDDYKKWRTTQSMQNPKPRLSFREYADEVWKKTFNLPKSESKHAPDMLVGALMSPDFRNAPLKNQKETAVFLPYVDLKTVHWVAAAGNYGLHFPLYPAAWPNVIGVSASGENYSSEAEAFPLLVNGSRSPVLWSNWGDVTERGQVFEYDRPGSTYPHLYYYGTSFAAPLASLRVALTLIRDTFSKCQVPDLYPAFQQNGLPLLKVLGNCLQ